MSRAAAAADSEAGMFSQKQEDVVTSVLVEASDASMFTRWSSVLVGVHGEPPG
jgi:hypothetical protein